MDIHIVQIFKNDRSIFFFFPQTKAKKAKVVDAASQAAQGINIHDDGAGRTCKWILGRTTLERR